MDLFNRKKLKMSEEENRRLSYEIEKIKAQLEVYKNMEHSEKLSNQLVEENKKLINWIMNILETFGKMEVKDRSKIQIPVMEREIQMNYNSDYFGLHRGKEITIPEITIINMRRY